MRKLVALLLVGMLGGPAFATDSTRGASEESARLSTGAAPSGVLAASARREAGRLARAMGAEPRRAQPIQSQQPKRKGWIARHPKLSGALLGFGVGCGRGRRLDGQVTAGRCREWRSATKAGDTCPRSRHPNQSQRFFGDGASPSPASPGRRVRPPTPCSTS